MRHPKKGQRLFPGRVLVCAAVGVFALLTDGLSISWAVLQGVQLGFPSDPAAHHRHLSLYLGPCV